MGLQTLHDTMSVQDFVDLYRYRRLNLSPAFQRRSVWTERDRRLLIDSVLDGIPLPAIYLYKQVGKGGTPIFDVIDGKQRLETLLFFMGKGPLSKQTPEPLWIRRSFGDGPLEWWQWRHLSVPQRHTILDARIPTIEVEGELSEIIELFVRINATGKHLTAQEKRHAHYFTSPILKAAQDAAEELQPFLTGAGVLTRSQTQRMKHIELVTELLLAVHAGMPLHKKKKIDEVIGGAALATPDLMSARSDLRRAVKVTQAILPDLKSTRFHQVADFYTLVLLLCRLRAEGLAVTAGNTTANMVARRLLVDFGQTVDEVSERVTKGRPVPAVAAGAREYLLTVREGTDSKAQRDKRERILRSVLDGVFAPRASRRGFTTVQRRILWHAAEKKICYLCDKPIARWEDMTIDHVDPYSKGGATELANGAIAHQRCNARKGAS